MAGERRERPGSFMYEPSSPPTIRPGLTVRDWRGRQARCQRQRGKRRR
jgi:hypothetical protein